MDEETCTVQMLRGFTNFKSTVVKPYYMNKNFLSPTIKNAISSEKKKNNKIDQEEPLDLEQNLDWELELSSLALAWHEHGCSKGLALI